MSPSEAERVREQICDAIVVKEFYAAPLRPLFDAAGRRESVPLTELIADAEQRLGVPFPPWLRTIYESCNGFATHTGECILYPLHGSEGTTEFTLFLREMEWQPSWMSRAIVFGYVGGSGSITTHTVALDGELVEWTYQDGEEVQRPDGDLFVVWRRIQALWDSVLNNEDE
jgi:hypothetical protein